MADKIKIGDSVRWSKKTLNLNHWGFKSTLSVKVINIETHEGTFWEGNRTIHFETPLEKNWSGETMSAFERWLEVVPVFKTPKENPLPNYASGEIKIFKPS